MTVPNCATPEQLQMVMLPELGLVHYTEAWGGRRGRSWIWDSSSHKWAQCGFCSLGRYYRLVCIAELYLQEVIYVCFLS